MASIAPLDEEAIRAAAEIGAIVTVEEHSIRGGLGGAVAEVVAGYRPCPVRILGFPGSCRPDQHRSCSNDLA